MRIYGGGAYPAYLVDADTLREELLSEEDTREWLEEVPDDAHAPSFWRMLGELDRALESGEARLAEQEPGSVGWGAAAVRLAAVHHWRGAFDEAHELLDAAEELAGSDPGVLALALHHRATALLDQGRYAEAREAAARALVLREGSGGDPGLVEPARETLARVELELA